MNKKSKLDIEDCIGVLGNCIDKLRELHKALKLVGINCCEIDNILNSINFSCNRLDDIKTDVKDNIPFIIWSNEHQSWWKCNQIGYTTDKSKAGVYSFEIAKNICDSGEYNGVPNETMLPFKETVKI